MHRPLPCLISLWVLLAVAAQSPADESAEAKPDAGAAPDSAALFDRLDRNGDGQLTADGGQAHLEKRPVAAHCAGRIARPQHQLRYPSGMCSTMRVRGRPRTKYARLFCGHPPEPFFVPVDASPSRPIRPPRRPARTRLYVRARRVLRPRRAEATVAVTEDEAGADHLPPAPSPKILDLLVQRLSVVSLRAARPAPAPISHVHPRTLRARARARGGGSPRPCAMAPPTTITPAPAPTVRYGPRSRRSSLSASMSTRVRVCGASGARGIPLRSTTYPKRSREALCPVDELIALQCRPRAAAVPPFGSCSTTSRAASCSTDVMRLTDGSEMSSRSASARCVAARARAP